MEERACADVFSAAGLDWMSDSTGAWYSLIGEHGLVSATALRHHRDKKKRPSSKCDRKAQGDKNRCKSQSAIKSRVVARFEMARGDRRREKQRGRSAGRGSNAYRRPIFLSFGSGTKVANRDVATQSQNEGKIDSERVVGRGDYGRDGATR